MCGGIKKGFPLIEQHPLQIRQRPVQKAQSQKKHCHRRTTEHEPNRVANSSSQKRALETVVPGDGSPFKATAVSSVDGAKVSLRSSASQPVRQEIAKQDLNSAAKVRRKLVF